MYSLRYAQTIRNQHQNIVTRPDVQDVRPAGSRWLRRHAGNTIAVLGVCVATISGVAVSDASAKSSGSHKQGIRVSASQLQRESKALEAVGFVATSCEVGGTRMTNYQTHQSLLLPW